MSEIESKRLLEIPEVVEQIKRHLWIESEKAGHDIGFEKATEDWINRYAKAWIEYHKPNLKLEEPRGGIKALKPKKRRAQSYLY